VVAHNEVLAGGDDHLGHGAGVAIAVGDVVFLGRVAVDPDAAMVDEDGVAGERDDALDVAFFRIAGIVEDDDVAAGDFFKVEEELVDEEAILIAQLGLHAGAFNAHGLVEHGDDEERRDDGDADVPRPDAVARMQQAIQEAETGMEHGQSGSSLNLLYVFSLDSVSGNLEKHGMP